MKTHPDHRSLLDDVLAESAPGDFGDRALGATLHAVRRHRRLRRIRKSVTAMTVVVLGGICAWWSGRVARSGSGVERLAVVQTTPLPADNIVHTRALAPRQTIFSTACIPTVRTPAAGPSLRHIGDTELLALTRGHPAVLVREGPATQALIFLDPLDRTGFPAN